MNQVYFPRMEIIFTEDQNADMDNVTYTVKVKKIEESQPGRIVITMADNITDVYFGERYKLSIIEKKTKNNA